MANLNFNLFFDFDNTITTVDVLDELIKKFSLNKNWQKLEVAWQKGEIGSKECLKGQLAGIRISKKALLNYLRKVKIDRYFLKLISFLKAYNIKPIILSDSFSFMIKIILKNYGIKNIPIYANQLRFSYNRLIPDFPLVNKACLRCGHCKRKSLEENIYDGKLNIYIGDGLSDLCAASCADLVFAKGRLLKSLKRNKKVIPIKNLKDVYFYLKRYSKCKK